MEVLEAALRVPRPALVASAFVLGLLVGSFLNVVIHRLPRGESIVRPRSRCPRCGAPVRWFDNVPVVSYLWLRGRCRGCEAPISPRYPIVEAVTGVLFALVALRFGAGAALPVGWAFAAALVAAAVIDYDHQIIPDEISVGGLLVALAVVPLATAGAGQTWAQSFARSLGGAALGGGLLWTVGFAHARLAVARGRSFPHWPGEGEALPTPGSLDYWTWFPGVGFGDVKLLAMIGAVLGPFGVVETLVAASAAGLAFGGIAVLVTRRWDAPFGFAPALAAGALLALLGPGLLLPGPSLSPLG